MEIASATAGETAKSAVVHVQREFGYLIHFRKSVNTLKDKIQQLTATKTHVEAMINTALRNGELVNAPVQDWMRRVDTVLVQASKVSDEASIIKGWFSGWCCGRFSLGRKAEKKIEIIQGLSVEGIGFGSTISSRKPTQSLKLVGTEDFNAFASRDSTAEEIRQLLLDDLTNLVGVYGMPGVGKTTLVKALAKQAKETRLFEEVVVVTVSQNPSLLKLQGDIAEVLDLSLNGDNLSVRAQQLSERLDKENVTTLVILDDIWERIVLSEVGIPYKNKGKCCKVVFTTRDQGVCDRMEANAQIEVALLSQEDSWILFCQKAGTVANLSIATQILSECKFLPLAIVTLGLALRNKNESVCVDALEQLRKSIFKGMTPVVFSIKLSYNFLESEASRMCFLFCCLFPEDHKIGLDVLLNYMMGEKLLEDVDTYEEARGRLYSIVDELVSSGLLLRDEEARHDDDGYIMMHDVVRDVAISISRKEHQFIVKAGRNMKNWPDMELGNCKRLSMMHNSFRWLPELPIKAPRLQALFLNNNWSLTKLPPDVFVDLKCLMTLDLSYSQFTSLPSSLSCLRNLRSLLLDKTKLTNLSPIGMLERLEVLSLRGCTDIKIFPEEMQNLSNLRILDLTGTSFRNIRPNLIPKLHKLELFRLSRPVFPYSLTELDSKNFFLEVASLSQLTSLELQVVSVDLSRVASLIEIPGLWENLGRFKIMLNSTGFVDFDIAKSGFLRSIWITIGRMPVANWVLVLLGRTEYLELKGCDDLESLTELDAPKGMNDNLKSLRIYGCDKMECLVHNIGLFECFSSLEELHFKDMGAFVEICKGTVPSRFFCKLKKLSFDSCGGLVTAIPLKLIHNLLNLKSLAIEYCKDLQYVLETEEEDALSNLEELTIKNMVAFVKICKGTPCLRILYNLRMLSFKNCNSLVTAIPRELMQNLQNLESLKIDGCENLLYVLQREEEAFQVSTMSRIPEPLLTPIFPNLKKFEMDRTEIRYVFTMTVARNLLMLEQLVIIGCDEMEVLLKYGDLEDIKCDEEFKDTAILARLKMLNISTAPKLQSFINRNLLMELPSLEALDVRNCGILERLPFNTTSVPNLKTIKMDRELFDRLEWEDQSLRSRLQSAHQNITCMVNFSTII